MHASDLDCTEIDVAPEFVCLSFNACGQELDDNLAALELENNE